MEKIKKKPLNLTIHPKIKTLARKLMDALGHRDFSGLFEDLIRREYEKRIEAIKIPGESSSQETALGKGAVKALDADLQQGKHSKEIDPGDVHQE